MLVLVVVDGPAKGAIYEVDDQAPLVLGPQGAPIALGQGRDAGGQRDGRARLAMVDGAWCVDPLGTRALEHNHQAVGGRTAIRNGDRLRIDSSVLVLTHVPGSKREASAAKPRGARTGVGESSPSHSRGRFSRKGEPGRAIRELNAPARQPSLKPWLAAAAVVLVLVGLNLVILIVWGGLNGTGQTQPPRVAGSSTAEAAVRRKLESLQGVLTGIDANVSKVARGQSSRDEALGQLRTRLADNQSQPDIGSLEAKLNQVLARLDQPSQSADAGGVRANTSSQGLLRAMEEGFDRQQARRTERFDQLLALLNDQLDQSDSQRDIRRGDIAQVLAAVRGLKHSLPSDHGEELSALAKTVSGIKQELAGQANSDKGDAKAQAQAAKAAGASVANAEASSTQDQRQTQSSLTPTQRAYKRAFENGEPVRLGKGQLNPTTGGQTQGRLLDPEAAKAAGFTTWRDWYLMDDFAERMRMQRQASDYRMDAPDPSTIKLPGNRETLNAETFTGRSKPPTPSSNEYP